MGCLSMMARDQGVADCRDRVHVHVHVQGERRVEVRWTFGKLSTVVIVLSLLFPSARSQTDPSTTTYLPNLEEQNQTTAPAPITLLTTASSSSTDAQHLARDALNATAEAASATPNPNATISTASTTTAKMEMTYIARMPTTPAPTDSAQTPPEDPLEMPDTQLLNATLFEIQLKSTAESLPYNISNPQQECILRSLLEPIWFNFQAENGGTYCPSHFDEINCWKASPPGMIDRQCPEFFRGIAYNTNHSVTRLCLFNGTWGNNNKSDYDSCTAILPDDDIDPHKRAVDMIIYTGYSLSFTTLVGAFFILIYFKSLRCVRNYIHLNLVSSFLLLYLVFFISIVINTASQVSSYKWYCRLQIAAVIYLTLTNFFWMFVEGLYLHTMVVRALTVRREKFWMYCVIGWGVPIIFSAAHAITLSIMKTDSSDGCLSKSQVDYIIRVPIIAVILMNVGFLSHIIIILVTKLRASNSFETQQYRKGVRGIVVLLPLLGAAYFMLLVEPNPVNPNFWTHFYGYLNAFLQSTQGFFVAIIYVYMNQEVQNVIKRRFRRWREQSTLPSRHHSRRGSNSRQNSMANNMSQFRKGSQDDNTMRTVISWKTSAEDHMGNGKLPSGNMQEELLPLRPVQELSPVLNSQLPDSPSPESPPADDRETTALTARDNSSSFVNDRELDNSHLEDTGADVDGTATIDYQDLGQPVSVGSDEALIAHGSTPIMEQNLFVQDKLENNNRQSNGIKGNDTDEKLLSDQSSALKFNQDSFGGGGPGCRSVSGIAPDGNLNNSNNTQLPCILKTAYERPYSSAKKHVAFVRPDRRSDPHSHPQQFFEDGEIDAPFNAPRSLGLSPPPQYGCSTIASDPWTGESDRSKWSPKLLFKRPRCHGSPTAQRLVLPTPGDQSKNGRIKLPKSPAGTPV